MMSQQHMHVMTSEHPEAADDSHDTRPPGDQPYHQSSTVLRVLLGTSPSSTLGWRLLRPLHTTCSSGRTAALRTIQHLPLDRAHNQGLPYTRQLDVLAAADQAIALTIHSEQIQGLLESLEQQHQLAADVAALEATLNTILAMEGSCRGAPYLAANSTSTSTTSSSAVITTTTTSCSKGVNTAGAASTQPFLQGAPAVTPRGPQFGHITVDGELTRAAVQQLVKLLDVLPGTQHLHTLVLTNVPTDSGLPVDQLYWDKHVRYSKQRLLAPQDALAAALTEPELSSSSNSTSYSTRPCTPATTASSSSSSSGNREASHGAVRTGIPHSSGGGATSSSSSSSSSSWRSSCRVLLAGRHKTRIYINDLAPLLEACQQLQGAVLQGMWVQDLPLHLSLLRPLTGLQLSNYAGLRSPGVLLALSGLTNLRHLGLASCMTNPFEFTSVPAAFSALVYLTSLDLSYTYITGEGLEGACGITSLRSLNLSTSYFCSFLPDAIRRLTNLEHLDLWYSAVHRLPEVLTALTGLRGLYWGSCMDNGRVHLEDVWQLTSLQCLRVKDDNALMLPSNISQLTRLSWLCINSQSLEHLPNSISALVGLKHLNLFTRSLQGLPGSITVLTQLTSIKLGHSKTDKVLEGAPAAVKSFVEAREVNFW